MQATVKMETGSPSSIRLLSNMPTRHGPAAEEEEKEGGRGLEGLRDGRGGLGVSGRRGGGVSVSIRHRLTADSCARRGHGQLTRTRPELASCVCACVRA